MLFNNVNNIGVSILDCFEQNLSMTCGPLSPWNRKGQNYSWLILFLIDDTTPKRNPFNIRFPKLQFFFVQFVLDTFGRLVVAWVIKCCSLTKEVFVDEFLLSSLYGKLSTSSSVTNHLSKNNVTAIQSNTVPRKTCQGSLFKLFTLARITRQRNLVHPKRASK